MHFVEVCACVHNNLTRNLAIANRSHVSSAHTVRVTVNLQWGKFLTGAEAHGT